MKLDPDERADLAERLLDSLRPADAAAQQAWQTEIRKRVEELGSRAVEPVAWEEARARIFRLPDADPET
jgi:putative addiction module component (TIGR02574 family)